MYRNLRQCIDDLAASGRLKRIDEPIDARLEAAEIQRRVFRAGGPALYFANVNCCRFPMVSNLFGTLGPVIKMRSRIGDRRALIDIGASGPLVGFVLAVAACAIGISMSQVYPKMPPVPGEIRREVYVRGGATCSHEPLSLK